MSETAAPVPAGWYPDPAGGVRSRWWDGTQWTDDYSEPYGSAAPVAAAPTALAVYTPFVWGLVGLLVLSLLSMLTFNFADYMSAILLNPDNPLAMFTPAYLFLMVAGFLSYWGSVALAFFDHRALTRAGVQSPFHWAFTFISPLVYLFGRAIVLKRRVGSGSATLWIAVGYIVATIIITVVWVVNAVSFVMQFTEYSQFS